jgi:hypothetical protein
VLETTFFLACTGLQTYDTSSSLPVKIHWIDLKTHGSVLQSAVLAKPRGLQDAFLRQASAPSIDWHGQAERVRLVGKELNSPFSSAAYTISVDPVVELKERSRVYLQFDVTFPRDLARNRRPIYCAVDGVAVKCDLYPRTPRLVVVYPVKRHGDKITKKFNLTIEGVI